MTGIQPVESLIHRLISLDLEEVDVVDAIDEVSSQIGRRIMYDEATVTVDGQVTLRSEEIRVGDALEVILEGTGLEVAFANRGSVILLRPEAPAPTAQDSGSIRGRVVDADTEEGIAQVTVSVDERRGVVTTNADGVFVLGRISAGERTLTFNRVGYQTKTLELDLAADQDTAVVVSMSLLPIALREVVATGSGDRTKLEIGNSTVSVNVDSIMSVTPVSSVSELLANRVPGLMVLTGSGAVGSPSRLRLRGTSSIESGNEPLIIVDGVRFSNTATERVASVNDGVYGGIDQVGVNDLSMRLDDIDPNTIASVEVMKGPAASTMYGAEAANGVIIINTKRGEPGPPRWSVYTDYKTLQQVEDYEYPIHQIGYPIRGGGTQAGVCTIESMYNGNCVPEEGNLRGFNMLKDPRFTPQARGYTRSIGASLTGGVESLQYHITGTVQNQLGNVKMPEVNRRWIERGRGGEKLGEKTLRPNAQDKASLSARITAQPQRSLDFTVGTTFATTKQRVGSSGVTSLISDPRLPSDTTPVAGWEDWYGTREQEITHVMGNASANWRPAWRDNAFSLNLTYGWDLSLKDDEYYVPKGSCDPTCSGTTDLGILGFISRGRRTDFGQTVNLGTSFTLPVASWLTSHTRFGGNYNTGNFAHLYGDAQDLQIGVKLFAPGGTTRIAEQADTRTTAGWYLEQQINLRQDRLFFTVGLRQDAGSSIGETVKPIYPKWNASWLVSEESFFPLRDHISLFRLRFATGSAGLMPTTMARERSYNMNNDFVNPDGSLGGFFASIKNPGNPDLRAEHSREYEGGVDIEMLDGRLWLDFTYFQKNTTDAIYDSPVAGSVGPQLMDGMTSNLGNIRNKGFELAASLELIDFDIVSYRINGHISSRSNKLLSFADGYMSFSDVGSVSDPYAANENRLVEGYPLFGRWARPILAWADANGDGRIQLDEVVVGDSMVYIGPPEPKYMGYIGNQFGFFNNQLTIHANFSYSSGMTQFNEQRKQMREWAHANQLGEESELDQACVIAGIQSLNVAQRRVPTDYCFMETFSLIRFQDLSIGYTLPPSIAGLIGANSGSLLVTTNNIYLWSNYKGLDPHVNTEPVSGNTTIAGPAFPAPRQYGIRFQLYF